MRIAMSLALALFLLPAAACGGDDDDDTGDDATSIDASGGSDIDAGDGSDDDGGDDADAGPEVDSGPVRLCGGIGGLECEDDEYCDYEDDSCGNNDTAGTCTPRPAECEPDESPVCGCDGEAYENKCLAAQAGTDAAEIGVCK